ncbi:DUF5809 family protein [Halobaculum roseum]|uniref:DUF5809 family protein n=1 Tax=Halobaculum roseum TaxID=2175149 RepID=A0ABD5MRC8_9EURY|nr:DUF5809 family protein [Halobaculum roseum]
MDTEGTLAPATPAEAREEYETLVPAAKVAVREAAKAMEFDREEYADRVTGEVIETVRDALFASLLEVHVGTREEYEAWLDDHPEYEPDMAGSDNVDNVVWHPVAFAPDSEGERSESSGRAGSGAGREQSERPEKSSGERGDPRDGEATRERTKPVVAATWQAEREAALGTLRRRAFGRAYRPVVDGGGETGSDEA